MLKLYFHDVCYVYILVMGAIKISGVRADAAATWADESNKQVICKTCTQLTIRKSEINNTLVDNAKDLHVGIPMHNLIECSDNYAKKWRGSWQCRKDDPNDRLWIN